MIQWAVAVLFCLNTVLPIEQAATILSTPQQGTLSNDFLKIHFHLILISFVLRLCIKIIALFFAGESVTFRMMNDPGNFYCIDICHSHVMCYSLIVVDKI